MCRKLMTALETSRSGVLHILLLPSDDYAVRCSCFTLHANWIQMHETLTVRAAQWLLHIKVDQIQ